MNLGDKLAETLTRICAIAIPILLAAIALLVGWRSLPAIQTLGTQFLITADWDVNQNRYGVLAQVYGTLVSTMLALIIAVPVGVGVALFVTENFLPRLGRSLLRGSIEILAAIPSVIYGLWGIYVLVPFLQNLGLPLRGGSMLAASLVLAIMVLPIIIALSQSILTALPSDLRLGAMAVGATRWETICQILLPAAKSGIGSAVMLSLGRAMGETMAVTMLIGNRDQIKLSLFAPANTIAAQLATKFAEAQGLEVSSLMYAALVLFTVTLVVNGAAELLIRRHYGSES